MMFPFSFTSQFQFPPPRGGERAGIKRIGLKKRDFNSRPREGANGYTDRDGNKRQVFQFPPPRGGERGKWLNFYNDYRFQFPPPRGGERGLLLSGA